MKNKNKSQSVTNVGNNIQFDDNKIKNFTTRNLVNVTISNLKDSILKLDSLKFDKFDIIVKEFPDKISDCEVIKNRSFNDSHRDQIKELICQMSNYSIETDEYLELSYKIISLLQNYFISEEYLNCVKSLTKNLIDSFSNSLLKTKISYYKDNLILDLDETLIHSEIPIDIDKSYNYIISEKNIGLFIRPYLLQMLKETSVYYNIFIFSAAKNDYIKSILDKIEIEFYFSLVLDRDFCISPIKDFYIKDLNMFQDFINNYNNNNQDKIFHSKIEGITENLDLAQETIIVDNHLISFANNLSQGIVVNDFLGDKEDDELQALSEFLKKLKKAKHDSGVSLSFLLNKSFDYSSY